MISGACPATLEMAGDGGAEAAAQEIAETFLAHGCRPRSGPQRPFCTLVSDQHDGFRIFSVRVLFANLSRGYAAMIR